MRDLRLVLLGSLLVFLDLRVDGFDVLADPLGWLLAAVASSRLRPLHVAFRFAAGACAVGVLVGLPGVLGPETGLLAVAVALLQLVLVFATCTAIHALLPDDGVGRAAGALRWVDLALTLATVPLGLALEVTSADGAVAVALVVLGAVISLLVVVAWLVVLALAARRAPGPAAPTARPTGR